MAEKRGKFEDSIVGDVRRARAKLLDDHGNDLNSLVRELMAAQAARPERVVNLRTMKANRRTSD
ncbi:MAG TPA: hypothetical protein VMZ50_08540 [Phycisphaerae bacterium]|nr:hypothetical protein [Phycisphaerae bacterium]